MKFSKIIVLDYEMYNSKNYYSICWAGRLDTDERLNVTDKRAYRVNPQTDKQFTGKNIVFPFTSAELKREKKFGELCNEIFDGVGEDTLIIGHGFLNDIKMTLDACHKDGVAFPSFYFIDTNVCISATEKNWCEKSLSSLASALGFTFTAHDPVEDSEATLAVLKNLLVQNGCSDIYEFIDRFGIVPGRVTGGLVLKSYYGALEEKQRTKIIRHNGNIAFALGEKSGSGKKEEITGLSFAFDSAILSDYDVRFVMARLFEAGGTLAYDGYIASRRVTNNILMANRGDITFKDLCLKLDFSYEELSGLSFYPEKVRDEQNNPISYSEYLSRYYARIAPCGGKLKNKIVVFSKTVEMANDFEEVFRSAVTKGAKISPRADEADIFVVNRLEELDCCYFDGRIRAYKKLKKEDNFPAKLMEKKEFSEL